MSCWRSAKGAGRYRSVRALVTARCLAPYRRTRPALAPRASCIAGTATAVRVPVLQVDTVKTADGMNALTGRCVQSQLKVSRCALDRTGSPAASRRWSCAPAARHRRIQSHRSRRRRAPGSDRACCAPGGLRSPQELLLGGAAAGGCARPPHRRRPPPSAAEVARAEQVGIGPGPGPGPGPDAEA